MRNVGCFCVFVIVMGFLVRRVMLLDFVFRKILEGLGGVKLIFFLFKFLCFRVCI